MNARVRLRYRNAHYELPLGNFLIGRASGCQLVLDDPRVSRQHVLIRVEPGRATVEDLGSRNGVQLNGVTLRGPMVLAHHDRLNVGSQELSVLIGVDRVEGASSDLFSTSSDEITGEIPFGATSLIPKLSEVERLLLKGEPSQAEALITRVLVEASHLASQRTLNSTELEAIARAVLNIAAVTGRTLKLDVVFHEYRRSRVVMPAFLIDEIATITRRAAHPYSASLGEYAAWLRGERDRLSTSEQLAADRIDMLADALKR